MSQAPSLDTASQQTLASPLSAVMRREPVACPPEAGVRTVLKRMREQRIGSMVVVDRAGRPIGIFTLRDLVETSPSA